MYRIEILEEELENYKGIQTEAEESFAELEELIMQLRIELSGEGFRGEAKEQCLETLNLIARYQEGIYDIYSMLNSGVSQLQQGVSGFENHIRTTGKLNLLN